MRGKDLRCPTLPTREHPEQQVLVSDPVMPETVSLLNLKARTVPRIRPLSRARRASVYFSPVAFIRARTSRLKDRLSVT